MSHIDEGGLHAYLDGALDDYPVAEARRVREHLERCEACRGRLEDERALRARAQSILGLAAPDVDAPPLEELRARARHRRTSARPSVNERWSRVGWAASVLLALGTGWLLRGGMAADEPRRVERDVPRAPTSVLDSEVVGMPEEPSGERVAERRIPVTPAQADRPRATDPVDQRVAVVEGGGARPVPAGSEAAPLADVSVQRDVGSLAAVRRRPSTTALVETAPSPRAAAADGDPRPADRTSRRVSDRDGIVTSASQLTPLAALAGSNRARMASERDREVEEVDYPAGELYSLVVPGLELIEVRFRGDVRPEGQVVLQSLGSGDTLTVIHLPPGIDPSTLAEPVPGELQVTVQRATGSIVMRAPRSEEELLDLMERLLGAP